MDVRTLALALLGSGLFLGIGILACAAIARAGDCSREEEVGWRAARNGDGLVERLRTDGVI